MAIEIKKKKFRGEDSHKSLSIRIPLELSSELDKIAANANISRNALINVLLTEGVKSVTVKE